MGSKFWPKYGHAGVLHHFTETLVAFEYTSSNIPKPHSLLFIGSLGDGLATTSCNQHNGQSSSDTDEVAECVRYISDYKATKFENSKIVLMGHSTGSQVVLHYLHRLNPHISTPVFDPDLQHVTRPDVDGAIMQAPVSDREAIQWVLKEGFAGKSPSELQAVYHQIEAIAKDAARRNQSIDTIVPLALSSQIGYPRNVPISCRRLMSLICPESPEAPREDDLFSSDLSDEQLSKTFGMIKTQGLLKGKLVVLFSGADQSVPDWVDKENLLQRWKNAADHAGTCKIWDDEYSAVLPGASHALSDDDQAEPRKDLDRRVLGYVHGLEQV